MKAETILILDPQNYSTRALKTYEGAGRVLKNGIDQWQQWKEEITTLIVRLTPLPEDFLKDFQSLKCIVSPTTGLTHIDLEFCRQAGITVLSLKGQQDFLAKITSTSELTLGLILSLLRRIPEANRAVVEDGGWDRERFKSRQCSGLSLGIIGCGRIGRHVARFAEALAMELRIYDPFISDSEWRQIGREPSTLDETLRNSDILTIHADDRRDNWGMINRKFLSGVKPGALLINTSRGELLDEAAVFEALKDGTIGGLAADVLANEHTGGHLKGSPLIQAARAGLNVIITPHIGGCSSDAMELTECHMASLWWKHIHAL